MSFYETKDVLVKAIATFLNEQLVEKGLDAKSLVAQHNAIISGCKDRYSTALLYQGVRQKEAPVFSNVPYSNFNNIVFDKLEEVFYELKLPTTQQQVSELVRKLKRLPLTEVIDTEKLLNSYLIRSQFTKIGDWMVDARGIIVAMSANFPLLAAVTEAEKEFSKLFEFDYYYEYSDSSSVWRSGKERHAEQVAKINAVLCFDTSMQKVVETIANYHRLPVGFFTDVR